MKRKIVEIDESKCNGCRQCIPNCAEGALQLIDGKARLVGDLFCDGLGNCIGHCPTGAMRVVEREADPYDERQTMLRQILPKGLNTIKAHLAHLKAHGEEQLYREGLAVAAEHGYSQAALSLEAAAPPAGCGCPGGMSRVFARREAADNAVSPALPSALRQWPVQLALVNPAAGFFERADLLVAADCAPFAYGDFHRDFIAGKVVVNFCPKLDDRAEEYVEKLAEIFRRHAISSLTVVKMEVPCCGGTEQIVRRALERAGSSLAPKIVTLSLDGGIV